MEENRPFEHNGFTYTENGIEYPADKVLPAELYKYYAFNKYSVDAFVNNYLFFSHPDMLNDLIDSTKFLLDFRNCDKKKYDGIMKYFLETYGRFEEKDIPSFEKAKSSNFREMLMLVYSDKFDNKGVLSLSEKKYDTLMMAHYANESGFVIEFDIIKLEKHLKKVYIDTNIFIYPMNYDRKVVKIDYFKSLMSDKK